MTSITTIGFDIAKSVFQVHVIFRKVHRFGFRKMPRFQAIQIRV
jgi:hypothetical protein